MKRPKMAACHLLAEASQIHGMPNVMCTRAYDCADCTLFQAHVEERAKDRQGRLSWVCPLCLSGRRHDGKGSGELLGFYDSGACSHCHRNSIILSAVWETDPATS